MMSIKIYALIYAVLFLIIGILGFMPKTTPNGYLMGIFQVNIVYNALHFITGIIALLVSFISARASAAFFKVFGIVYLFLAALGILLHGNLVFVHSNSSDAIFHLVLAAIAFYFGFGKETKVGRKKSVKESPGEST
jgi:hypothetical protein